MMVRCGGTFLLQDHHETASNEADDEKFPSEPKIGMKLFLENSNEV